jgi:hypothetical protein
MERGIERHPEERRRRGRGKSRQRTSWTLEADEQVELTFPPERWRKKEGNISESPHKS